ncbi:hypothetical protein T265_03874 [Opisthorchis viverrini]|uniref:Reverse transcriptase domain-containing protein n=1 Tax=Opisthorchis viverrini TaxID=6198 RepID=A0A075A1Q9_OPIVI|nr:hypothetical protein T265_03874 [Opisthorchis viverrini]KER29495.1 hypothetical protein T265_03874 [Opisthorchis viverrini]
MRLIMMGKKDDTEHEKEQFTSATGLQNVAVYGDDSAVYINSEPEVAVHLKIVLKCIREAGLRINETKTPLVRNSVSLLENNIGHGELTHHTARTIVPHSIQFNLIQFISHKPCGIGILVPAARVSITGKWESVGHTDRPWSGFHV